MIIKFDSKLEPIKNNQFTFSVYVEEQGCGTNQWLGLFLSETRRIREVHGVESVSWCKNDDIGDDSCEIIIRIAIFNNTPNCDFLFPTIVVAITETNEQYKEFISWLNKINEQLKPLKRNIEENYKNAGL